MMLLIDVPVGCNEAGAALISGFSPAMLKAVMGGEELTPMWVMRQAIDDPRYDLVKRPEGLAEELSSEEVKKKRKK